MCAHHPRKDWKDKYVWLISRKGFETQEKNTWGKNEKRQVKVDWGTGNGARAPFQGHRSTFGIVCVLLSRLNWCRSISHLSFFDSANKTKKQIFSTHCQSSKGRYRCFRNDLHVKEGRSFYKNCSEKTKNQLESHSANIHKDHSLLTIFTWEKRPTFQGASVQRFFRNNFWADGKKGFFKESR